MYQTRCLYRQTTNITTWRSKPTKSPFITRFNFLQFMIIKFFYLVLIYTYKVDSIARNTITILHETITYAPNILSNWINKPRRQRHKKRHKTSHGGRKFSQNLRESKISWYNQRNCKSGRYNFNNFNLKVIFIKVSYINYCIGHQSANIYTLYCVNRLMVTNLQYCFRYSSNIIENLVYNNVTHYV